jgi:hypothetical protein
MDMTFDSQTLSDDLTEVTQIYGRFFASLEKPSWDKPVKGGPNEWTLHKTIAHLTAFHCAGLESMQHALRGDLRLFLHMNTLFNVDARPKGAILAKTTPAPNN